jgi:hypothetical protein
MYKKMKSIILTLNFLSIATFSYSQYDFLFKKETLSKVKAYEDSLKSKVIGFKKTNVEKGYFPTAKDNYDYYPFCYARTNDGFYPTLNIEYFYNEKDSTLLATSYDWNIMDFVSNIKTEGYKFEGEIKRKKEYLEKYQSIKGYLVSQLGKPSSVEEDQSPNGYFYRLKWKEDKKEVLVIFQFSNRLMNLPNDMKVGSFSIRVKINYL